MIELDLSWTRGGTGRVVRLVGEMVAVRSSIPSPPGSRIEGKLVSGEAIRVKIHASKKQDDGSFQLEGRLIDLSRDLRLKLEEALREPAP